MNDFDFVDTEERIKQTNTRALKNRETSKYNIWNRYYNWRIKRIEDKKREKAKEYSDYIESKTNEYGNKEYSGWFDYQATRIRSWRYERKIKKLENKLLFLNHRKTHPNGIYKMFSKGLEKLKRVLALTPEQLNEIKGTVQYKEDTMVQEDTLNKVSEQEINEPTEFKEEKPSISYEDVDKMVDEQLKNIEPKTDEQTQFIGETKSTEFKEEEPSIGYEDVDKMVDEKVAEIEFGLKPDTYEETKEDDVISVLPENQEEIVENEQSHDISNEEVKEQNQMISAEQVQQGLDIPAISNIGENKSTDRDVDEIQIVLERHRVETEEKENRINKMQDVYETMTSPEADAYFEKSNAMFNEKYPQKRIDEILNSTELSFEEKRKALQEVKDEYKASVEAKQQEIEKRRQERADLEQNILNSLAGSVQEVKENEYELDRMLEEESQEVSSLQEEYNAMKGK